MPFFCPFLLLFCYIHLFFEPLSPDLLLVSLSHYFLFPSLHIYNCAILTVQWWGRTLSNKCKGFLSSSCLHLPFSTLEPSNEWTNKQSSASQTKIDKCQTKKHKKRRFFRMANLCKPSLVLLLPKMLLEPDLYKWFIRPFDLTVYKKQKTAAWLSL